MNLLQTYSMECGVRPPEKPHDFPTSFVPLPSKYITLSTHSGVEARDYRYFDLVAAIMAGPLAKDGVSVIHLAVPNEPSVPNTIKISLNLRQTAHALKHSLCHLTVDNATAHLAGSLGTPIVELFGPAPSDVAGPYYKGVYVPIEAFDKSPSYNLQTKEINSILPEVPAAAVAEILGLTLPPINTRFIGQSYNAHNFNFVPNFDPDYSQLRGELAVRMDQYHDERRLVDCLLKREDRTTIIFNRPIQTELPFHKIGNMIYIISEKYDKAFLRELSDRRVLLIFDGSAEKLAELRLEMESPYNFGLIHLLARPSPPENVTADCRFSTKKVFLSTGRTYASLWHMKHGIPGLVNVPIGKALNTPDFLESLDNYYIYKNETTD